MDIVHMTPVIVLIPDNMIPEPALPDTALTAFATRSATRRFGPTAGKIQLRKSSLDRRPSHRETSVIVWQGPDTVQMVGEDNDGVDVKGMVRHFLAKSRPQVVQRYRAG